MFSVLSKRMLRAVGRRATKLGGDRGVERGISSSDFRDITHRIHQAHGVKPNKPRVLLISSNGAGLGHLTRLSAVGESLEADNLIYTMSSAYKALGRDPRQIVYFPSYGDLGMNGVVWNSLMESHLSAVVDAYRPSIMVFDGTFLYKGVSAVARKANIELVWLQRGCWKPSVDQKSQQRHNAHQYCDAVIVPGDYGCREKVDLGQVLEPTYVEPVTLLDPGSLLSRRQARERLHLPLDQKLFLIQVGAGIINEIGDLKKFLVREVEKLGDDWLPVLVENPLQHGANDGRQINVQAFPLSRYFNAFDAAAFAAGYNSVQESVRFGLPSVFIPNSLTKTDDQERRAQGVASQGLGFAASTKSDISNSITELSLFHSRERIKRSMRFASAENGSVRIASILDSAIELEVK